MANESKGTASDSTPPGEQHIVNLYGSHPDKELIKETYRGLPQALRKSLKHCADILLTNRDVAKIEKWLGNASANTLARTVLLHVYERWYLGEILGNSSCLGGIYCYSSKDSFPVQDIIVEGRNVVIMGGKLGNRKVIAKWSKNHSVTEEIDVYKKLRKMGCPTPWFDEGFYLMGEPVLVMEKLHKLGSSDDPYLCGAAVLEQLSYLHEFGTHNDIKPGNCMKRINSDGSVEYFLIDYGGVSTRPLGSGFRRRIWTDKYTAQPAHVRNQKTSAKYDFMELCYTIKSLIIWEDAEQTVTVSAKEIRNAFSGRLLKYQQVARELPEKHELCAPAWKMLRSILLGGNAPVKTFDSSSAGKETSTMQSDYLYD